MEQQLTHGSLFSGVGGFELGAQRAGIPTTWNCEISEYNRAKLKIHFPNTKQYTDVTTLHKPEPVKIISGGFPCQDISAANFKAEGITGARSGLWGHFARIISEVRPYYVLIENSPNLLKKGFEKVLFDLSEFGYNAEWECISAEAFGYPHKRTRLFVIAYANGLRQPGSGNIFKDPSNYQESRDWQANRVINAIQRKTLPPLCESNYGFPEQLVKNGKPNGNAAIYALGNAVVPAIAEYLYDCIQTHYRNQLTKAA